MINKCKKCWAYNIDENHACDGLMKALVDNHRNGICEEHGKVRKHCFWCRWTVEELQKRADS